MSEHNANYINTVVQPSFVIVYLPDRSLLGVVSYRFYFILMFIVKYYVSQLVYHAGLIRSGGWNFRALHGIDADRASCEIWLPLNSLLLVYKANIDCRTRCSHP